MSKDAKVRLFAASILCLWLTGSARAGGWANRPRADVTTKSRLACHEPKARTLSSGAGRAPCTALLNTDSG